MPSGAFGYKIIELTNVVIRKRIHVSNTFFDINKCHVCPYRNGSYKDKMRKNLKRIVSLLNRIIIKIKKRFNFEKYGNFEK